MTALTQGQIDGSMRTDPYTIDPQGMEMDLGAEEAGAVEVGEEAEVVKLAMATKAMVKTTHHRHQHSSSNNHTNLHSISRKGQNKRTEESQRVMLTLQC